MAKRYRPIRRESAGFLTLKSELWQSLLQQLAPVREGFLTLKSELWQSLCALRYYGFRGFLTLKSELWQSFGYAVDTEN